MLRRNIKIKLIMTKHSDDVKNGEICRVRQIPVNCRAQILKFSRSPEGEEEKGGKLSWDGGGRVPRELSLFYDQFHMCSL